MTTIDEHYAWRLLRDAAARGARAPVCLGCDAGPAVHVDAGARWYSDADITPAAVTLMDTLLPVALGGPRFVIAQIGQSLDGRIATDSGHSHYVTGEASRVHLHRLRALVDAVIVGAATVTADDPRLTVRHAEGDDPVRVVLDPRARVPHERVVFTDAGAPTLHLIGTQAQALDNVETRRIEGGDGGVAPERVLACLAERGLTRVLVEGGGVTISRFLEAGLLDRLHVVVAPLLIGSGRPAVTLPPIARLDGALRPPCRSSAMGDDVFFDLDLRAPHAGATAR